MDLLFDYAAVHVVGERPAEVDVRFDVTVTDSGEEWTVRVRHGVLNARPGHGDDARATVSGPKQAVTALLLQPGRLDALVGSGAVVVEGDRDTFATYASVVEDFDPAFPIVTP